jgi:hypothetical protein
VHPTLTIATSGVGAFVKATSVTLNANRTSPQFPGTNVTFTAAGAGAGVGATYYYRFSLFNGATWSVVQPTTGPSFGTGSSWAWAIPLAQMPANYSIKVEVTTNQAGGVADATQTLTPFTVSQLPAATGVLIAASRNSPQPAAGLNVRFTATGSGSAAAYSYQFLLVDVTNGKSYLMQDWSTTNIWNWSSAVTPVGAQPAAGSWQVIVNARTSPWQAVPATRTMGYTLN